MCDSISLNLDFAPGEWRFSPATVLSRQISHSQPKPNSTTSNSDYFTIPKPTITPEMKSELAALRLKQYMNPKRFYKSSDKATDRFVLGVVVDGGLRAVGGGEESQSAGTFNKKKTKGKSLLQEALADAVVQNWTKKRWTQVEKTRVRDKKLSRQVRKKK
jgi:hypothetical protein